MGFLREFDDIYTGRNKDGWPGDRLIVFREGEGVLTRHFSLLVYGQVRSRRIACV